MSVKSVVIQGSALAIHKISSEIKDEMLTLVETHESNNPVNDGLGSCLQPMTVGDSSELAYRLNLFSSVLLPVSYSTIERELTCKTVIHTKNTSWRRLKRRLNCRNKNVSNGISNGDGKQLPKEIFAVYWPESFHKDGQNIPTGSRHARNGHESGKEAESYAENGDDDVDSDFEMVEDDDNNDMGQIAKVSDLVNSNDQDELENRLVGLFSFSGTLETGQNFIIVELNERKVSKLFTKLCEIASSYTIHWFQACTAGFMWRKTHGPSLSSIRSKCSAMSFNEAKWFNYVNLDGLKEHHSRVIFSRNVICIAGVAGSGKTDLLASTAKELKQRYKDRVVCFINLKIFNEKLEMMDIRHNLTSLNFRLFIELLFIYFEIKTDLEKALLTSMLSSKWGNVKSPKVELLLDGLDEMSEKMRNYLLNFLKEELESSEDSSFRVWITTRPHLKPFVEDKFSIIAYNLENLEIEDVLSILEKEKYKDEVTDQELEYHLKLDLKNILVLPHRVTALQSHMARMKMETLFELSGADILNEIYDSAETLYKSKALLFNEESKSALEAHVDKFPFKHAVLACYVIANQILSKNSKCQQKDFDYYIGSAKRYLDEEELLSFGFVKQTEDPNGKDEEKVNGDGDGNEITIEFENDSFPSYFLAKYFASHIPGDDFLTSFFLKCVLFWDECDQTRMFFMQMMTQGLNVYVANGWCEQIENFLIEIYDLSDINSQRLQPLSPAANLLQLSIINQNLQIAKLILHSFKHPHQPEIQRLIESKVEMEIHSLVPKGKDAWPSEHVSKANSTDNPNDDIPTTELAPTPNNCETLTSGKVELSSLSLAIMFGDSELLDLMYFCLGYEEKADHHIEQVSKNDNFRFSPIHLAVLGCNLETLKYITSRNVSTNNRDLLGHVPLHLPFYNKWTLSFLLKEPTSAEVINQRTIQILKYYNDVIDHMIIPTTDRMDRFPLYTSTLNVTGNTDNLLILTKMKKNLDFTYKRLSLKKEIYLFKSNYTYFAIIEKLAGKTFITRKDSERKSDSSIEPPFHLACAEGYIPHIECLLRKNANINIKDQNRSSALLFSIKKGDSHVHVAKFLIENGIDKRELSKCIQSIPLPHYLVTKNEPEMLEFVIETLGFPLDSQAKHENKRTMLHIACSIRNCLQTVKLLLKLGADVNAVDRRLLTPLMYACTTNRTEGETGIYKNDNIKLVKLLLDKGAFINARSDMGITALHNAVKSRNLALVKLLISHVGRDGVKVNVNLKTSESGKWGETPLHYACKETDNLDILKCLIIDGGASVDELDLYRNTPLMLAVLGPTMDKEMIEFLVEHKSNLFNPNKWGRYPWGIINKKDAPFALKLCNIAQQFPESSTHQVEQN